MARIPITFEKIFSNSGKNKSLKYLVSINDKGSNWNRTLQCSRRELLQLKTELDKTLSDISTSELLGVSIQDGNKIDLAYKNDPLCKNCSFKYSDSCKICLFELDSPLERKLFIKLKKSYLNFEYHYGIDRKGKNINVIGKSYDNPKNNFKDVLTIADFYLEKNDRKLCVYTDGHTYHDRTEDQAKHDKSIDRKLQEKGFTVYRYTGKDVNENCQKIVDEIKEWLEKE